jgi:hypothetical protein
MNAAGTGSFDPTYTMISAMKLSLTGSGLTLDLRTLGSTLLTRVDAGTGNTVTLDNATVTALGVTDAFTTQPGWSGSGASLLSGGKQLSITGNSGDTINIGSGWTQAGSLVNAGVTYDSYTQSNGALPPSQLLINHSLSVVTA